MAGSSFDDSTQCLNVFISGADICGPGVRIGFLLQVLAALLVAILPKTKDTTVITFAILPLITGLAQIIAGFVQAARGQIAYFQQSVVVWLAAMAFAPAAVAWLRRPHGRIDRGFMIFTIVYILGLIGFLIYTIEMSVHDTGVARCFLDEVPSIVGVGGLRGFSISTVVLAVTLLVASLWTNLSYDKNNPKFGNTERPKLSTWWEWAIVGIVFIEEILLFVLAHETVTEYLKVVPESAQVAEDTWSFGQIVPFVLLLYPIFHVFGAPFALKNALEV